jgi:hypothetical protein
MEALAGGLEEKIWRLPEKHNDARVSASCLRCVDNRRHLPYSPAATPFPFSREEPPPKVSGDLEDIP